MLNVNEVTMVDPEVSTLGKHGEEPETTRGTMRGGEEDRNPGFTALL